MTERVGIIGWHEGSAGSVDSWLPEIGYECEFFIAINDHHLRVDRAAHAKFGNKKFSYPTSDTFKGRPLIYDPQWFSRAQDLPVDSFVVALDNSEERLEHICKALSLSIPIISPIHPTVTLQKDSEVGPGCILHAGALIGYKAVLGKGVIVNTRSSIDHHCVIEDGATIDPGCVLAGNVLVKKHATLHTSTTVINKIVIGEKSVTGAGSLVIRDVANGETVIGVPARPMPIQ